MTVSRCFKSLGCFAFSAFFLCASATAFAEEKSTATAEKGGSAVELGVLIGGAFNLRDSTDGFLVSPYLATKSDRNEGPGFFMPITVGFATGLPAGVSAKTASLTPSFEYDIPLILHGLYVSPSIGLSLGYQRTNIEFQESANTFNLGIPFELGFKYILKNHIVFRFVPAGVLTEPWHYTDQGVGSSKNVTVSYLMFGGVGYRF